MNSAVIPAIATTMAATVGIFLEGCLVLVCIETNPLLSFDGHL